ncbi:MAG: hypothetical protein Q9198_004460 [Flavoplaca austrocitrina]
MERKRWNELTCPLCPAILDSNTVEKYAPEETVRRTSRDTASVCAPPAKWAKSMKPETPSR